MANIYLKKQLYDEIVRLGFEPKDFVHDSVEKTLKELKKK